MKDFGEEEVKKLVLKDAKSCLPFVLPAEQQKIEARRLMSAYLTESLIKEMDRSHVDVGFKDVQQEFKAFAATTKNNLKESLQICGEME